jgi:hypothetical protein
MPGVLFKLQSSTKNMKSLNDRIRAATTTKEVIETLAGGRDYTYAHPRTKRKWGRVALERMAELGLVMAPMPVHPKKIVPIFYKRKA